MDTSTVNKISGDNCGVELIPQKHGGALAAGGIPGNKGGLGRPRDEIRRKLVNLVSDKGLNALEEILDATRDRDHMCSHCGEIDRISPPKSDADMLKALDLAGKYGLGTYKEVEEHKTITLIAPSSLV